MIKNIYRKLYLLLSQPVKANNLVKCKLARKFPKLKISHMPYKLDIEPTTHCNFACSMCQVSDDKWISNSMSFSDFKEIIDNNKFLLKIKLQGMGEPFLNKELIEMARYARSKGIYVVTTTNGSVFNEKNIEDILTSPSFNEVIISIDGATKSTFELIRSKSKFERVIEGTNRFIEKKKDFLFNEEIDIIAWTVIQKDNWEERYKIIDLCANLKFETLVFQMNLGSWGRENWNGNQNKMIGADLSETEQLKKYAESKNIKFRMYEDNILKKGEICSWPFEAMYVDVKQNVVPCCVIGNSQIISMGNLKISNHFEIWNANDYKEFRNSFIENNIYGVCKDCYKFK